MARQKDESMNTSRRQFTGMALSAAVAAPLAAYKAANANTQNPTRATAQRIRTRIPSRKSTVECPVKVTTTDTYTELVYGLPEDPLEDHIPPMGLEGGGSLVIDFAYDLRRTGSGSGPFDYVEQHVDDVNRYGLIKGAFIVAEVASSGYLTKTEYTFAGGPELWIWYQAIDPSNPSGSEEVDYFQLPDPLPEPDIAIRGGQGAAYFRIRVKRKSLDRYKSHKGNRPYRLKHSGGGDLPKHFRIGLWRFVTDNGRTTVVEGSGAENYTIHVDFEHYQGVRAR